MKQHPTVLCYNLHGDRARRVQFGSLTPEIEKKQRKKRRGLIFLSNCSHYSCTMYHNVL